MHESLQLFYLRCACLSFNIHKKRYNKGGGGALFLNNMQISTQRMEFLETCFDPPWQANYPPGPFVQQILDSLIFKPGM